MNKLSTLPPVARPARVEAVTVGVRDESLTSGEFDDLGCVLQKPRGDLLRAQQQAIDLAFFQRMSQRELAAHTNISLGTIKTRLELAVKKLSPVAKPQR